MPRFRTELTGGTVSLSVVWLIFELHYLFDDTSILELHSCTLYDA